MALCVRQNLNQIFPILWTDRCGSVKYSPRSPDLSLLDFFLWGHLKNRIYITPSISKNECRLITPEYTKTFSAENPVHKNKLTEYALCVSCKSYQCIFAMPIVNVYELE